MRTWWWWLGFCIEGRPSGREGAELGGAGLEENRILFSTAEGLRLLGVEGVEVLAMEGRVLGRSFRLRQHGQGVR